MPHWAGRGSSGAVWAVVAAGAHCHAGRHANARVVAGVGVPKEEAQSRGPGRHHSGDCWLRRCARRARQAGGARAYSPRAADGAGRGVQELVQRASGRGDGGRTGVAPGAVPAALVGDQGSAPSEASHADPGAQSSAGAAGSADCSSIDLRLRCHYHAGQGRRGRLRVVEGSQEPQARGKSEHSGALAKHTRAPRRRPDAYTDAALQLAARVTGQDLEAHFVPAPRALGFGPTGMCACSKIEIASLGPPLPSLQAADSLRQSPRRSARAGCPGRCPCTGPWGP